MARVWIPSLWRDELTGGHEEVEAEGDTLRQIVASLEARYPGLGERLVDEGTGRLRPEIAGAVDGEIAVEGLRRAVRPDSQIQFLPALSGGN
ncbi:MAG: MoaD/ThiS family protein [Gemmatimonadota bacterium]